MHADSTEPRDTVMLLLKLGNEAGGKIDRRRIMGRPPTSSSRAAYELAEREGLVSVTGHLTPTAYRELGAWLDD
jgi:hypothetical protein